MNLFAFRLFCFDFVEVSTGGAILRVQVHFLRAGALAEVASVAAVIWAAVDNRRNRNGNAMVVVVEKVTFEASAVVRALCIDAFLN